MIRMYVRAVYAVFVIYSELVLCALNIYKYHYIEIATAHSVAS